MRVREVPEMLMGVDGPVVLEGRRIGRSLSCVHCQHDLNGVAADARCPECGSEVVRTLQETIDPLAHRLPPVHRPNEVGWALVALAAGLAVHAGFMVLFTVPYMVGLNGGVPALPGMIWSISGVALMAVVIVAAVLIWPRSTGEVERSRGLMVVVAILVGGLIASLASLMPTTTWKLTSVVAIGTSSPWGWVWLMLDAAGMAVVLLGMRSLLVEVGRRSRAFRHAGLKRQRISTLVATLVWVMIAAGLALAGRQFGWPVAKIFGGVLVVLTECLVVLGLLYLVLNTWWVRSAIAEPPPRLLDLLD